MAKELGPLPVLFDYEDEQRQLEAKKQQKQQAQQRIMRTNSVGDAFRLLIDAAGGSKGATITPKPINAGTVRAADRYHALEEDYDNKSERLKLRDLDYKERNAVAGLDLERENRNRRDLKEQQGVKRMQDLEDQASTRGFQREMQGAAAKNALNLENTRAKNDSRQIAEKYQGELEKIQARYGRTSALAQKGLFEVSRYDNPVNDTIVSRNQVVGLLDDLKKHLIGQGVFPSQMPRVLQNNEVRGKISDDDLKFLIGTYKDFFQPRLPELSGGTPSENFYKEPNDKDVLQMWYNTMGSKNPLGPVTAQPKKQQTSIPAVKPDKSGDQNYSIYWNN